MTRTPLKEYLDRPGVTQKSLACAVNLTQGAISRMFLSDRTIFVIETDGRVELREERVVAVTPDDKKVTNEAA